MKTLKKKKGKETVIIFLSAEIAAIRAGFMEFSAEPCSNLNQ